MGKATQLRELVVMLRGISHRQAGLPLLGVLLHTIAPITVYMLGSPRMSLTPMRPGLMSLKMATIVTYPPELESLLVLPLSIWQTHSIYQVKPTSR